VIITHNIGKVRISQILIEQMSTSSRLHSYFNSVGAVSRGFLTVLFICWLLSLVSYSPSGRETPLNLGEMDWIAISKLSIRIMAILLLGVVILRMPRVGHKRFVIWRLMPFVIFSFWTMISSLWSPLKAVSLGHGIEVFMFLMLAALTGMVCVEDRHISTIYFNLSLIMFFFSLLCLTLWYAVPSARVTIDRYISVQRLWGFSQLNFWGHVAGAGLITIAASFLIWKWTWSKIILFPSIFLHGWALFLTQSRTAIFSTLLVLCLLILFFGSREFILKCSLICTIIFSIYLSVDPKIQFYEKFHNRAVTYIMRGQTRYEFQSASGRLEEWKVGIESFMKTPLIGCGYYTMTKSGFANIWGKMKWHNPHNVYLHVLTGTGIIGGLILLWAFFRLLKPMLLNLHYRIEKRKKSIFVLIVISWFFVLGLYELSFLGPVGPVTVLFFVTLGIEAGNL